MRLKFPKTFLVRLATAYHICLALRGKHFSKALRYILSFGNSLLKLIITELNERFHVLFNENNHKFHYFLQVFFVEFFLIY